MTTRTMRISIPTDPSGYFARECPKCEGTFKVMPGTGLTGIEYCYCAYCGHKGANDTFWTQEQIEYAKSIVANKFMKKALQTLKRHEFEIKPKGVRRCGPQSAVPHPKRVQRHVEQHCNAC